MAKGWIGVGPESGTFVSEDKAFAYALERCANAGKEEKQEFVEWYYSGNWVREEEEQHAQCN